MDAARARDDIGGVATAERRRETAWPEESFADMTGDDESTRVMVWWTALSVVALFNVITWARVATKQIQRTGVDVGGRVAAGAPRTRAGSRAQVFLSGLFVLGCAFRSFLPRSEGQRICLYDSWLSSAVLSRGVATIAELALMAQFTLVLRACAGEARSRAGVRISYVLLPLIAVAEVFSWYTTLTTNFIGSVIEESLWATTGMLMTATFAALWPRLSGQRRTFVGAAIVLGVAYVAFMWRVDVPMYWARRSADRAAGKAYVALRDGWGDAHGRRIVTRRWRDWRNEMPWMSLYFSAGVWISMALVEVPRPRKKAT